MRFMKMFAAVLVAVLAMPTLAAVVKSTQDGSVEMVPTGKGWGRPAPAPSINNGHHKPPPTGGGQYGIFYHNGPIMTGTTKIYYIWYGTWTTSQQNIMVDFANGIGGTPYFNINTTYWGANNTVVANSVAYGGSSLDNYSQGTNVSDGGIYNIVNNAITSGALPKDANGVYFVMTSPDVNETSGFCTSYCGWHTNGSIQGSDIKYSFIGDPDRCPGACEEQTTSSPNGDTGVDGMANIVGHELDESVTDPDGNAWYDSYGRENGDKCAWTFGPEYTAPNGSLANVNFGGRDWLIQQNWANVSPAGFCTMSH